MLKFLIKSRPSIFTVGLLAGTAGVKILKSRDAKKVYTHATAAVLRAKEDIMCTVSKIQAECDDIYAEAKQINEQRDEDQDQA